MFEATTNPDSRWRVFWPDVGDRAGASDAVRISTLLLGIAAVSAVFDIWIWPSATGAWQRAAALAVTAFGVWQGWRAAPLAGVAIYTAIAVRHFEAHQLAAVPNIAAVLGFANGVRGTFARARLGEGGDVPAMTFDEEAVANDLRELTGELAPPRTTKDAGAWDDYWQRHARHGVAGLGDIWVMDGELVDAMRANGLRTVLCVGNGVSQEPRALAWAGFDVTALDLSPYATALASSASPADRHLARLVEGRSAALGGRVQWLSGSLCDPALCPGPYDVVIERCTLQQWPEDERDEAVEAVVRRLAPRGLLFTQAHNGGLRPIQAPRHPASAWFAARQWPEWAPGVPIAGQVVSFFNTSG